MRRKSCLLAFPDDWISYSPSVLNLLSLLNSSGIATKVITFRGDHPVDELPGESLLLPVHKQLKRVLARFKRYSAYSLRRLVDAIRREPRHDHYIGVDSIGSLALQLAGVGPYDFFSLEVRHDEFFRRLDYSLIRCIVIQSVERYDYLFPDGGPARFLLQNSPRMDSAALPRDLHGDPRLIFLGTAIPSHGILECIDFVSATPDLTLEVCGLVTPGVEALVSTSPAKSRITINPRYVPQTDLRDYLSSFDIGLCLYNVENSDFNYQSVPSGKLFNYFSAALPVVATNLPGLRPVRDFAAGVLLESNSARDLGDAIGQIRLNYPAWSRGAAHAANHFSFDRMALPYVASLG
jgi:glycosyltransferase involved in cell wall biosynthesis